MLEEYSEEDRRFIVKLGKFVFNEHKILFEKQKDEKNFKHLWDGSEKLEKYLKDNKELKQKLEEKENKYLSLHESIYEKIEEKVKYFKDQIFQLNNEKQKILEIFNNNLEKEVKTKTLHYESKIQELEKKVNYYYNLYVDINKGSFYEKDLYEKLEEYNNKKLNNIWRITHVGNYSEKCDFQFRNKDNGYIILLDTKNNTTNKPVAKGDIDKFIRDVNNKENNAVGGILLANDAICNKKSYEMNIINKKVTIYISYFSFTNVEFIFTTLDIIMEMHKVNTTTIDNEYVKKNLIEDYKFIKERVNNNNCERKKLEQRLREISDRYFNTFNDDIELSLSQKGKKIIAQNMTNTKIVDFEELEKERLIIGKRSKYYLQFSKDDEKVIQYFQSNYPREKKIQQLKKQANKNKTIIVET